MKIVVDVVSFVVRADVAMPECPPDWHLQDRPCPYGKLAGWGPGDYTWPNEGATWVHYVAAFYSLMPLILAFGLLALLLWKRGTRELLAVVFWCLQSLVMFVLKAVLAGKRPEGSCLVSCGMPSGHTIFCFGFFSWIALEVWLAQSLGTRQKSLCLAAAAALLLPVGWSRTALHDHSWAQVVVGGAVALALAGLWCLFLRLRLVVWALKLLCANIRCLQANFPPDIEEEAPWLSGPGYGSAAPRLAASGEPEGAAKAP